MVCTTPHESPPCPVCDGTGTVGGKDCAACGGTGTATDWK
jgi:DnaJ-class molecular chaperone